MCTELVVTVVLMMLLKQLTLDKSKLSACLGYNGNIIGLIYVRAKMSWMYKNTRNVSDSLYTCILTRKHAFIINIVSLPQIKNTRLLKNVNRIVDALLMVVFCQCYIIKVSWTFYCFRNLNVSIDFILLIIGQQYFDCEFGN